MMTHQKRLSAPSSWPVERKTHVFTVGSRPGPHGSEAVPLVVFLRDILGYVDNAKEARYALRSGGVLINGKQVKDFRTPIGMFDIVSFPTRDEYYRVFPGEGGRLSLTPIDEEAASTKLAKITDKTVAPGGRTQLNLHDGSNLVLDDADDYSTGDSIVIDVETREVVDHFVFEEGDVVTAVDGKHSGEVGTLLDIRVTEGSSPNTVSVEREDGTVFETVEEYVFVIGEELTRIDEEERQDEGLDLEEVEEESEIEQETEPEEVEEMDEMEEVEEESEEGEEDMEEDEVAEKAEEEEEVEEETDEEPEEKPEEKAEETEEDEEVEDAGESEDVEEVEEEPEEEREGETEEETEAEESEEDIQEEEAEPEDEDEEGKEVTEE